MKKFMYCLAFMLCVLFTTGCTNAALVAALTEVLPDDADVQLPDMLTKAERTFSFEPGEGALVWWSADNTPEQRMLTGDEADLGTVTLSVPKGSVMPVLLYRTAAQQSGNASASHGEVPRPIGCIWPLSTTLDAAGGFPARMLWRLLTETEPESGPAADIRNYCARFNWKRFCLETAKLDDPWELDQQKILLAIAAGTFALKDLKQTPH